MAGLDDDDDDNNNNEMNVLSTCFGKVTGQKFRSSLGNNYWEVVSPASHMTTCSPFTPFAMMTILIITSFTTFPIFTIFAILILNMLTILTVLICDHGRPEGRGKGWRQMYRGFWEYFTKFTYYLSLNSEWL